MKRHLVWPVLVLLFGSTPRSRAQTTNSYIYFQYED